MSLQSLIMAFVIIAIGIAGIIWLHHDSSLTNLEYNCTGINEIGKVSTVHVSPESNISVSQFVITCAFYFFFSVMILIGLAILYSEFKTGGQYDK